VVTVQVDEGKAKERCGSGQETGANPENEAGKVQ